jgi:hypothetical protein
MKTNHFLCIPIILFILALSFRVEAAPVTWSSESYSVYSWGVNTGGFDSASGSTLPVSSLVDLNLYGDYEYAYAEITAASMYIETIAGGMTGHSEAHAGASGTFFAVEPYFVFTYDFTEGGNTPTSQGISITDVTDSTTLFSQNYFDSSDSITVPTALNHEIHVSFGMTSAIGVCCGQGEKSSQGTLNYSMAVVPEPVSTILFITGGAVLAVRRFFG